MSLSQANNKQIVQLAKQLVPINSLSSSSLSELLPKLSLHELAKGKLLFKRGDQYTHALYLISGELDLCDRARNIVHLTNDSADSIHPLASRNPRDVTAVTTSAITYLKVDKNILDRVLTWDQSQGYQVNEISDVSQANADNADVWMTRLLSSELFSRISPENIQRLFASFKEISVSANQYIINQGEQGDYFYVIKTGRAKVTRKHLDQVKELIILNPGDGFGGEALISNLKRNASVMMTANGLLLKLSKQDFELMLKDQVLDYVSLEDMKALSGDTETNLLDIRLASEYEHNHLENSTNIPLKELRLQMTSLNKEASYIVYPGGDSRSAVAAYLLNEYGYNAYILQGEINTQMDK